MYNPHAQVFDDMPFCIPVETYSGMYDQWVYRNEGDLWKLCNALNGNRDGTLYYFKKGTKIIHLCEGLNKEYISPIRHRQVLEAGLGVRCIYRDMTRYPVYPTRFVVKGSSTSYPLAPGVVLERGGKVLVKPREWVIGKRRTHKERDRFRHLRELALSYQTLFEGHTRQELFAHRCMDGFREGLSHVEAHYGHYDRPNNSTVMSILLSSHQTDLRMAIASLKPTRVHKQHNWLATSILGYMNCLANNDETMMHIIASRIAIMAQVSYYYDNPNTPLDFYCSVVTNHTYIKECDGYNQLDRLRGERRVTNQKTEEKATKAA